MHHKIEAETRASVAGFYRTRVMQPTKVAPDGTVLEAVPVTEWSKPQHNLILPSGYNGTTTWRQLADGACHAGTGSTPAAAAIDGTYSQTGTTVSRVTGTGVFVSGNVGDYIKFAGGERCKIVTFTNSVTVTVDRSQTVAAATITIYDTSRTLLDTWIKATTTKETGANGFVNASDTGLVTWWNTHNFTTETVARSYTELGMAQSGTTSSTVLYSRIVLDSPVNVGIGQFLQVRFDIQAATANYRTSAPITVNVTGWPRPYTITSITPGTAGGTAFDILLSEACSSHYAVGRPIIVTGALPVQFAVTSYASTGSNFTVTTSLAHGRSPGDSIVIAGATPSAYNGTWVVATVPTSTTLTVTSAINPGAGSGGTVRQATPATWYDGTWTIASFPTASTIRVTNNTIAVAAGASGTVTNSTAANCIVAGYGILNSNAVNAWEAGPLEPVPNATYRLLYLYSEANMKTGLAHGVLASEANPVTGLPIVMTDGAYDATNLKRTFSVIVPSGSGNDQTIRQLLFRTRTGQIWVTYDERQRKDVGYQLTLNYTCSWEPDLI